jgi:capsular polysaccharide transport system permease protein
VPLTRCLAIQARVIWALLLREVITRFGRQNIGVLWLFVEPMVFTLGVATFWYAAGMHHGSGIPIIAFAITGYSSVLLWRNTVSRCSRAVQSNMALLYHRNVHVLDVLLARSLLEMAGSTASFVVLTLIFVAGEWIAAPVDLGRVLVGWLMLAWFGLGLALTIGAATAFSAIFERIWQPASYLLFPLSGAAFMADWWATPTREILLLLPMVHAVELMREGYFAGPWRYHYDLGYMAVVNLTLTLTGVWLSRVAARRVEAE